MTDRRWRGPVAIGILALLVVGCDGPPRSENASSVVSTMVPVSKSGPTTSGRETPDISPARISAAPCEMVARGSAGVPGETSRPLVQVRFSSTWSQSPEPFVVLYHDGTVAVATSARPGGRSAIVPFAGGRFSAWALDRLERQIHGFAGTDMGESGVYDAGEALVETFDSAGDPVKVVSANGFGVENDAGTLSVEQQRARRELKAWFDSLTNIEGGRSLGLARIGVAGNIGLNSGLGENYAPVVWPATAPLTIGCTILTGRAAVAARDAANRAAAKSRRGWWRGPSYTDWFRLPTNRAKLYVMALPPAVPCVEFH